MLLLLLGNSPYTCSGKQFSGIQIGLKPETMWSKSISGVWKKKMYQYISRPFVFFSFITVWQQDIAFQIFSRGDLNSLKLRICYEECWLLGCGAV
jgi:hypothetical protein